MSFAITHISTACTLLEVGSTRILTDPVFSPAGKYTLDPFGLTRATKNHSPEIAAADIGPIDILLLSHHDHADNLDRAGQEFLDGQWRAGHIVSSPAAAKRYAAVTHGLGPWETATIGDITITATPALHAPPPFSWLESRDHVVGWILEWPGQEHGAVYISGDTVLFRGVEELINKYRGQISLAILHTGGVRFWLDAWLGLWTLDSKQAAQVGKQLDARTIVPIHYDGWSHFKDQSRARYDAAFDRQGIGERLRWLDPGARTEIPV